MSLEVVYILEMLEKKGKDFVWNHQLLLSRCHQVPRVGPEILNHPRLTQSSSFDTPTKPPHFLTTIFLNLSHISTFVKITNLFQWSTPSSVSVPLA